VNSSLLKQWKSELKALGFAYKNRMFMYEPSESQSLLCGVSVQKNVRDTSSKINPSVMFRNPWREGSSPELLILGNLRADGVFLHVARSSWWSEDTLPEALDSLKTFVLPWFQKVGRVGYLGEIVETAIREKRSVLDVVEPLPESVTALPWATPAPRQVGSMLFYQAAVLHYLNGNRDRAILRTKDWLDSLPATDHAERTKALAQLEKINAG
jgi:hypothetical protein